MKTATGNFKLTMYLRPDQYLWLRAQALQGVMDEGGGRPDVSAIIRAMVDKTMADMEAARKSRRRK